MQLLAVWWQRTDLDSYGLLALMGFILILLFIDTLAAGASPEEPAERDPAYEE